MRKAPSIGRERMTGAAVLAVLLALAYVSFTANNGVPFASRHTVTVQVPAARHLVAHADVRVAGVRVGQVSRISAAEPAGGGRPFARVQLTLDGDVHRIPTDSRAYVRPASVLGATYIDLKLGRGDAAVPDGGTLAFTRATPPVEPSDLLEVFDTATRASVRGVLSDASSGVAGRGGDLNATVGDLAATAAPLTRVLGAIGARSARLPDVIDGLATVSKTLARVRSPLGRLVDDAAVTAHAAARADGPLGRAIDLLPDAENDATGALAAVRPALADTADVAMRLRPGVGLLPRALIRLNAALAKAPPTLALLPATASRLTAIFGTLRQVASKPALSGTVRKLAQTIDAVQPAVNTLAPAQTACNLIGLYARNFSTAVSLPPGGPALVNLIFTTFGASGEILQNAKPSSNAHINFLPHEDQNECESGNSPWDAGHQVLGSPPGLQRAATRTTSPPKGATDAARRAGLLAPPSEAGR